MDDKNVLAEPLPQRATRIQSWGWGVLLVLLGIVSLEMNSIERIVRSIEFYLEAVRYCDVSFGCCSERATRFVVQIDQALGWAQASVANAWVVCACTTVAFAVRALWCRDLPWLVRGAVLAYAMYTTVWTFLTQPVF